MFTGVTSGLSLLAVFVLLLWIGFPTVVEAVQIGSNAVCTSKHSWMVNSMGQTPCSVAAYLNYRCTGDGNAVVQAMSDPSQYYEANDEDCECNTVVYALFQACQACQFDSGTVVLKYSNYSQHCTMPHLNISYPEDKIPSMTAIPAWAYQNVTSTDLFDLTLASAVAAQGHPDTTGTAAMGPSTTFMATTSVFHFSATSVAPSTTGAPSTSGNADLVGPLVGGIVGGVVGLVLIGCLAFLLHRRHKVRHKHAPPQKQSAAVFSPIYPMSPDWAYEPWSPMSSTTTVFNSPTQGTRVYHPGLYPFHGLGPVRSVGGSPTLSRGQSSYHAVMSYTRAAEL